MHWEFIVPLLAVVLDLIFADPKALPHPVCFIGKVLNWLESRSSAVPNSKCGYGFVCMLVLVILVAIVVELLISIPAIGIFIALYFAYAGLSLGGLLREGNKVSRLIDSGDTKAAQEALAGLVTRDTAGMDAPTLRKTLAETMSENLNDGFIAPFFFLCLGGPALLWVYKTVNTMDSMWGHKTEQYKQLGCSAAKLDDILNYIPARITAFLMIGVGYLLTFKPKQAFDNVVDDAKKTDSPNAGYPMAAAAWLMDAAMGGKAVYYGASVEKPVLGPAGKTWDVAKLHRLKVLITTTAITAAVLFYAYFALVKSTFPHH
ncbi:adenosylcobinamide-phosphate synthase CbiB [Desulfovibrio inopinatus]|uniref:adenosylcobinamide-phosphate synthase CbiB n=1 Tax=Desulfovibrio inopinatus TaxID=102109 RepID=UPI000419BEFB|nr:adenosylcobinamide-phosphate synthase CbiB [Desulfovibrio inopinatus]